MERRHFPNSFRASMDQGRVVAPENGSWGYPVDNIPRAGVDSDSQRNSEGRANEYPLPHFSTEIPPFQPAFLGPSYDFFPQSSAAGNFYMTPQHDAVQVHSSYYDRCNTQERAHGPVELGASNGRERFKRKSPGRSVAYERGSTSRFYNAGSSSSSSGLPQEIPPHDYQIVTAGHTGLPHYGGVALSIGGQDSSRNVRSRLDREANPMRTLSSYSTHHYHPTMHSSSYRGGIDRTHRNADETTREWNSNALPPAHGRVQTSGVNGLGHDRNQLLMRGSGSEIGSFHPDSVSSRNLSPALPYRHAPPIVGAREGHVSHSQGPIPSYRPGLSYPRFGHEATSAENGLQSPSEAYSSRYSRPSARGWRSGHRIGRPRIAVERFQSISGIGIVHDRTGAEDLLMMDHSFLFASSRNLFDQYRDLRLDIDDMSYEELLALGERIGNVSSGLSEEMISKCLTETKISSDENQEDGTCCICLEEYANGEVGNLRNCGHNYHVCCIRKWLLTKNVCPICKAPALAEE